MYCLVVIDDYSRFTWVFFLTTKDETSGILESFITGIENLVDHKVKVIRCDNGTEFKNREMNQFCEMKGILRQFIVARTPQQNRVAERRNKTLIEAARTMLADSKLPTILGRTSNVGNTGSRGNQNNGQGVNNQRKVICYNCREEGHVARQCKEPKRPKDSLWHQDKAMLLQAKEKGAVLDAEAEAFLADVECTVPLAEPLALSTTNMFQVSHEDAYDSDVDDEPNATVAFMANLSSSSSQINEVRTC
ncbi:putative ribonuclease H-like domain-containing protein [Tanacetum coccineum]